MRFSDTQIIKIFESNKPDDCVYTSKLRLKSIHSITIKKVMVVSCMQAKECGIRLRHPRSLIIV